MIMNRRQFSKTSLAAAAATVVPRFARAEEPKTIALMFDAFDFDFWITGNTILKAKAKENGWNTLEIYLQSRPEQAERSAQSHGRA